MYITGFYDPTIDIGALSDLAGGGSVDLNEADTFHYGQNDKL